MNNKKSYEELKEEKRQLAIEFLENLLRKLKQGNLEEKGVSLNKFCEKYKNIVISSSEALNLLDNLDYTQNKSKNCRILLNKGKQYLLESNTLRINFDTCDIEIQTFPIIPPTNESFFATLLNKENFKSNKDMLKKKNDK